jgi:hypothetical protein
MSIIYAPGVTSKSLTVQIVDDSGLGVTGLVAATFPAVFYQIAGANAAVAFPSLSDLAAITTAWAAGGVKELSGGYYRLDAPDAMFAAAGKAKVIAEASGKHLLCEVVDVSYVQVDVRQLLGTAWLTPATPGTPDVNAKLGGGAAFSTSVAAAVLDAATSAHTTPGTFGAVFGSLSTVTVTVNSLVAPSGSIAVVNGQDYYHTDGNGFDFTVASGWPNLTTATAVYFVGGFPANITILAMSFVTVGAGSQTVRLELSATQANAIPAGAFKIVATLANGHSYQLIGNTSFVTKSNT